MADLTPEQLLDYKKFFKEKGDPGFSPERNKAVIDKTIREYEERRKTAHKLHLEGLNERAEAVAMYLKHLNTGKSTPVEKYFSRRELARLRGEQIIERIQGDAKLLGWADHAKA